ncbi:MULTISPECIES: rod-determining factor RdfA [Halorussus]|uniref:rod-determining factor RdfA n=1 Tax=Halorussus TaxID=1070314 RepID=UPI00209FA962|nr:rod-determining factor RdfA [Halorussus vallis]USZ78360.1 hypothetical protein NGM07_22830 [Halorussus vallis]
MSDDASERSSGRRSKVARVIDEYGLEGMDDELAALWTGDGAERRSLRELAVYFNENVLETAMRDAGMNPLDGEVENTYRLLTDDEVSSGVRTQTRKQLEREDIDVDRLKRDFVSHQAIHTYLTKHRDTRPPSNEQSDESRRESARDTVQRLQSRTVAVTENTLDRLAATDTLDLGDYDVLVETQVLCRECGTVSTVGELLEAGGCDCRT